MSNKRLLIGSHVSLKAPDFFLGSVQKALSYNANTFMIYTGAPQNTIRKDVNLFQIKEAHALMQANNINPCDLVVHAPYIINPCSTKASVRELALEFLIKELQRTHALGIKYLVLHPGSALDQPLDLALAQVANVINQALNAVDNDVIICLETMSGKGSEVGINSYQLQQIIAQVQDQTRIGVCLDTCHLHEAGYDLSPSGFDQYLAEFDQLIGLSYIKVLHINDSKNPIAAHKDRHENIGYGHIGFENLLHIIYHQQLIGLPMILETPWHTLANNQSVALYQAEIEMIKTKQWFDIKNQLK